MSAPFTITIEQDGDRCVITGRWDEERGEFCGHCSDAPQLQCHGGTLGELLDAAAQRLVDATIEKPLTPFGRN